MFIVNVVEGDNPTRHRHFMLWSLMAANVLLFSITWVLSDRPVFSRDFGFVSIDASWITPYTSIFLHSHALQLLGNLFFLWMFGDNVEDVVARLCFLIVFIVGGATGNFAYSYFEANSSIPLVGTSAAVSAIMGVYLVFFRHVETHLMFHLPDWFWWEADPIRSTAFGATIAWFVEQLILLIVTEFSSFTETVPVSVTASIAGFVVGIVFGLIFRAVGYLRRYSQSHNRHWMFGYVLRPTATTGTHSDPVHDDVYEKFPWLTQRQQHGKNASENDMHQGKDHVSPRA